MAASAEGRKKAKYEHLNSAHTFTPVAIESSGVVGQSKCYNISVKLCRGLHACVPYFRLFMRIMRVVVRAHK